jgi:uroporphyrin-III C-methyltransferase
VNGKVLLVGAGPGDPELLTVKAVRTIERADLILYDDLVSDSIRDLFPPTATAVNVGKRAGRPLATQEEIHWRMIHAALAGLKVVRLKAGDPLVFARAGEEIEALRRAGIDLEVIPGVTAAFAAAAAVQIPLTDRRLASKIVFLTAHHAGDWSPEEWRAAASSENTIVVYMPGNNFAELGGELLTGGLTADTPVVAVSKASLPDQSVHSTTLGELSQFGRVDSPAVLIIGEVAGFAALDAVAQREALEAVVAPDM